jgi:hypothetical protein
MGIDPMAAHLRRVFWETTSQPAANRSNSDTARERTQDASTIDSSLCQTKDRINAEYSLRDIQKPIGVSRIRSTHPTGCGEADCR